MNRLIVFCTLFIVLMFQSVSFGQMRNWTGSNGKVIEAEFISVENEIVKIRLKNGKESNVRIDLFSKADQDFVRNQGKTDDPFGGNSDPNEVIRVSLEVDEYGDGKIRLEKTSRPPQDDFKGKELKLSAFPKAKIRMNDDGISNMVFDFNEPDFAYIWYMWDTSKVDVEKKMLIINPINHPEWKIHGMGLVGFYPNSLKLPMKITCDVAQFKKEVFNSEILFDGKGLVFSCRVLSESGLNGPFTVHCRWGRQNGKERDYSNILYKDQLSLSNPQEFSFRFSLPNKKIEDDFRAGIGKNLNLGKNDTLEFESIGIKRLEISGRFSPRLGVFPKEDGGSIFIESLNTNGIGEKAGLKTGDTLISINGIKCKNLQMVNEMLNNCSFDEHLSIKVERKGKKQDIVVFEK